MTVYKKANQKIEVVAGWSHCFLDGSKADFEGIELPQTAQVREFADGHMTIKFNCKSGKDFIDRTFTYESGWMECNRAGCRPKLLNS